ncbi:hypothetical protein OKA05_06085 [Luteolibacter arcticus]|uniref:FG-GAP repeat-containing protein n=1 Tax=Luteolibacter arcticus TaxID=1581411 RepID=A0ABT3GFT0_9BACT|nr:hypothetical protein [Luteolibacter arcticus]MCW1922113.1 hypothetical protein [Luteolibacter arcticus]
MKLPLPGYGLCLALTAVISSLPALAQEPTFTLTPSADHQQLGANYVAVGDINGDGTVDLAISDPGYRADGNYSAGIVHLISGADGTTLRGYQGNIAGSQFFGLGLAALDVNRDGVADLAIGAPGQSDASGGYGAGAVWIFSGASGAVLSTTAGPAGSQYGGAIENAGDQNGDGVDDLYVGAPGAGIYYGAVHVQSGADGSTLRVINTTDSFTNFGTILATVGDVDGDGRADVAIGAPGFRVAGNYAGKVSIVRSSDGGTAAEITGTAVYHRLGESLAAVPDVNGDGLADLMVGSYSSGGAIVVSGRDLTTLVDLSLTSLPAYQQVHVGGGLDYDHDGTIDWLIGSPGLVASGSGRTGGIRLISGADSSTLVEYTTNAPYTGLGLKPRVLAGLGFAAGEDSLLDPETNGHGFAHVWRATQVIIEIPDTDGDGVKDDIDAVPNSILTATVKILGIDSTVKNTVDATGTSLADRFAKLGKLSDYRKPALYLANATLLAVNLARDKVVTTKEAVRLTATAAVGTLLGSLRR